MQRILIVDDEPKTAAYLMRGLSESGYDAAVARTGDEGLRLAAEESFDLVLLDVMPPGRISL